MNREEVNAKTVGRCAYCGKRLGKKWHIDHIIAKRLGGTDDIENLFPSCPRCNLWKSTYSIEEFRQETAAQYDRLLRDSASFRLAHDFDVVVESPRPVVFAFEGYGWANE